MSDEAQEDRTEAPSSRRMSEAMSEGNIPLGREINAVAGFTAGTVALMQVGRPLRDALVALCAASADGLTSPEVSHLAPMLAQPLGLALIPCVAAAVAGAIAYLAQTKGQIWVNLAMPDLSRAFGSFGGRLTRIFSREVMVDLGISVVKLVTLAWVIWSSLRGELLTLPKLLFANPETQFEWLWRPLTNCAAKVLTVLAVWAGVDIAKTRWQFAQKMKMTKEEAKRDAREEDGDPAIRARRRRRHRELAKGRAAVEVPLADALVVNPTHIAIAIRYRAGEDAAPRVTAKGKGELAEYMRELARNNGIPIVENIPLARLLYKRVKVGRSVPAETFKAVAAVLAYVYRITGRARSSGAERR